MLLENLMDLNWDIQRAEKYELKLREVPWLEVSGVQKLTQWYGRSTLATKFAKYFEMTEKRLKTRKVLLRKIRKDKEKNLLK